MAVDLLGIPGWDKVDVLARALVDLKGLSVTNDQARNIQQLYHGLNEFDKQPLTDTPHQQEGDPKGATLLWTR